ncbi:hypothetical protein INS49_015613 [Diaporthe citri]|uniref:uncharacterized protein n=1 Tax=Diaporthe citri TaxID=83186 RepID=UPI001C820170|nr:uncharacterized protein INS49_015613 [Diaporthe citri]KAG6356226.1 hypothetical protein INS49_015613 [Diaporthe citri]
MAFRKLVLIAVVCVVLYTWGLPAPLEEFFSSIMNAFLSMCFRTMVATTRLCSSYADYLEELGQNVCKDRLCPAYGPPYLGYKQQAEFSAARLLRQAVNFLNALGIKFLSYFVGDTLATIAMWLAVEVV